MPPSPLPRAAAKTSFTARNGDAASAGSEAAPQLSRRLLQRLHSFVFAESSLLLTYISLLRQRPFHAHVATGIVSLYAGWEWELDSVPNSGPWPCWEQVALLRASKPEAGSAPPPCLNPHTGPHPRGCTLPQSLPHPPPHPQTTGSTTSCSPSWTPSFGTLTSTPVPGARDAGGWRASCSRCQSRTRPTSAWPCWCGSSHCHTQAVPAAC